MSGSSTSRKHSCLFDPRVGPGQAGQILEGLFSAVSTPKFAIKASFENSPRDLHNTHLCTDLRSRVLICPDKQPRKEGEDLSKRFPGSSPATLDLMKKCLVFDPAKRIKVEDAVKHEAFKGVQSSAADNMPDGSNQVELEFEKEPDLNEKALRKWFKHYADKFKEIQPP